MNKQEKIIVFESLKFIIEKLNKPKLMKRTTRDVRDLEEILIKLKEVKE